MAIAMFWKFSNAIVRFVGYNQKTPSMSKIILKQFCEQNDKRNKKTSSRRLKQKQVVED